MRLGAQCQLQPWDLPAVDDELHPLYCADDLERAWHTVGGYTTLRASLDTAAVKNSAVVKGVNWQLRVGFVSQPTCRRIMRPASVAEGPLS